MFRKFSKGYDPFEVNRTLYNNQVKKGEDDNYDYWQAAQERKILHLQALGMQPIRDFWADAKTRGYSDADAERIKDYRECIRKNIDAIPASESSKERLLRANSTHTAHIMAAVESNTAPPSGSVMYHGGEFFSGLTNRLAGSNVAKNVFGKASEFFNNPIGDSGKLNRDTLSHSLSSSGSLLAKIPSRHTRLIGALSQTSGQSMKITNSATEIQYRELVKSKSLPSHMHRSSSSGASFFAQINQNMRPSPFADITPPRSPVTDEVVSLTDAVRAKFYLPDDD